jgi:hypothetical protein
MTQQKTCIDCLHCKISAESFDNCRACFCAAKSKKVTHIEDYWQKKPVCNKFHNMTERPISVVIIPTVALKRRPILQNRIIYL